MSTYLAALQLLLLQVFTINPYQPFTTLYEKSKQVYTNILEGAQETWQDVSEVAQEVSQDVSQKVKEQYGKVAGDVDIKKYIVQKIGEHEIAFFKLVRKVNAGQISSDLEVLLKQMKPGMHDYQTIQNFLSNIDSKTQANAALQIIQALHDSKEFSSLLSQKDAEKKAFMFELAFAFYVAQLIDEPSENADILSGLAYGKMFLKAELGIF